MKNNLTKPQKCVLIITDGIGHKPPSPYNAFANAKKPTYDWLFANVPYSLIHTYGDSVGLPQGQMGNSEVGHTSIGSGRILYQDLVRIQKSLQDGSLAQNPLLQNHATKSKQVHLLGLMSDGGVHSHLEHLLAVAKIYAGFGKRVWLHLITDGRDVLPTSALGYLEQVQNLCDEVESIKIASISGRYYAMDRDKRWERIQEAYQIIAFGENNSSLGNQFGKSSHPASLRRMSNTAHSQGDRICQSNTANTRIVGGSGGVDSNNPPSLAEGVRGRVESSSESSLNSNTNPSLRASDNERGKLDSTTNLTPHQYISQSYAQGITDEFIKPMAFNGFCGFEPKDGLVMINFRSDRAREIIQALSDESFSHFHRPKWFGQGLKSPQNAEQTLTMTQYDESFPYPILFPKITPQNTLAEVLSREGKTQSHIAETEKYAHVTFFFNGGIEEPFKGESRVLIPSPKVATYDLAPEMSAVEVGDAVCEAIKNGNDFVVVNFANGDMVGHTGKYEAAVQAVQAVDTELGKIYEVAKSCGYAVVLTSDHGNCEEMQNDKGEVKTNHTVGDVYCFVLAEGVKSVSEGGLNNIAPTVLKIMGLEIPQEMDTPLI